MRILQYVIVIIAMVLVQGSTLFQIIKFVKVKRTEGVSIGFWWAILVGLIFYLGYSITIRDIFYMLSNSIGIVLSIISISLYYHYRRKWERYYKCQTDTYLLSQGR